MKKFGKYFLFALLGAMMLMNVACAEGTAKESWYYQKTEMKTDGQLCTNSRVSLPASLWETPEYERYEAWDKGAAHGYFIRSAGGTWSYCMIGIPAGASAAKKVPGIVLVHGGGGTAYQQWVNFWVDRGYAAIAVDTEGTMPNEKTAMNNSNRSISIKSPHGPLNTAFSDIEKPIEDQWAYHAIADVIAANSFLRSFAEVDAGRIGVTGISYGGFLTWQTIAYDDRFLFAAPVYLSPCQEGTYNEWGRKIMVGKVAEYWDDISIIKENPTPILYVNSNGDQFASVEATTSSVRQKPNSYMTLLNGFKHGHDLGGLQVEEICAFADYFCIGGPGLIKFKTQPFGVDPQAEIEIPVGVKAESAWAFYATTDVLDSSTAWHILPADIDKNQITVSLPSNAVSYYINVIDDRNCEVSSQVVFNKE